MRIFVCLVLAICMPFVAMAQPYLYPPMNPDMSKYKPQKLKFCRLLGCMDGMGVSLVPPKSGWKTGRYEIIATIGDIRRSCELVILGPLWEEVSCDSEAHSPSLEMHLDVDRSYVGLYGGTPRRVRFELRYEGRVVAKGRYLPKYRAFHPNGLACDGTCYSSRALPPLKVHALEAD
jgi:hypothetical protein